MNVELAFSGWSGIGVLLLYGGLMLGVGIFAFLRHRGVRESLDEYYLGGRGLGAMVLFFTFFATQYSGNTVVGYPPTAYRLGYQYLVSVPFFIMIIMAYLFFAPRLYALGKRFSLLTPVDWIDLRFRSKKVTILAAILMLYGLGNYLLEQFVAIGQGVAGLTGGTIPYQVGVVFFIVIMVAYSWLGGMRSVAYTDTMQGLALLFGVFTLLIGSLIYLGDLPGAAQAMIADAPEKLGVPALPGLTTWCCLLVLAGTLLAAVFTFAGYRPLGIFSGLWGLSLNLVLCVGGSLLSQSQAFHQQRTEEILTWQGSTPLAGSQD